jgi:hypothetical protein
MLAALEDSASQSGLEGRLRVLGHLWGDTSSLTTIHTFLRQIEQEQTESDALNGIVLLVADCLYIKNIDSMPALAQSVKSLLRSPKDVAIICTTHHHPELMATDLRFFDDFIGPEWTVMRLASATIGHGWIASSDPEDIQCLTSWRGPFTDLASSLDTVRKWSEDEWVQTDLLALQPGYRGIVIIRVIAAL